MKSWADIGFEVEITGDGSPSLRLLESVDPAKFRGETMHHSGGACAETLLIYGEPARLIWQQVERPSFLVVGLGMGYIEMTIAREALLLGKDSSAIQLFTSYESVPELRDFFVAWLQGRTDFLDKDVSGVYDQALTAVLAGTQLKGEALKDFLRPHFGEANKISGALLSTDQLRGSYNGIFYDAFSSKTTPHLWEEEFLKDFLARCAGEVSLFSTYACRVGLRQALTNSSFELYIREGFMGKRNSTLGVKGIKL